MPANALFLQQIEYWHFFRKEILWAWKKSEGLPPSRRAQKKHAASLRDLQCAQKM
jgi:hypothetical protein